MSTIPDQSDSSDKSDHIQWLGLEKLLLLAVPYLLLTSYLYYAGYWGTLKIDIYPYLQLQDIVNGTAYALQIPLMSTALCAGGIIIANVLLAAVLRFIRVPALAIATMILLGIAIVALMGHDIIVPAYHLLRGEPYTEPVYGMFPSWTIPSPVVGALLVLLIYVSQWWLRGRYAKFFEFEWFKNEQGKDRVKVFQGVDFWPHLRDYSCLFALLAIPALAFPTGYYNAKNVIHDSHYSAVSKEHYVKNRLLNGYPHLKYLGRAGDYYFLLTPDNQHSVVLSADSLGTLLLKDARDLIEPSKQQEPAPDQVSHRQASPHK